MWPKFRRLSRRSGGVEAVSGATTDPFFANVVALLHFDGTNGSTTYTDQIGKTWGNYGSSWALTTAEKKYGTASLLGNTNGGISTASHADFDFGAGDFTVEGWFRYTQLTSQGASNPVLFVRGTIGGFSPFAINSNTSGLIAFVASFDGTSYAVSLTSPNNTIVVNTWHHVAAVRSGNDWYLFVDGQVVASSTGISGTLVASGQALTVGTDVAGGAATSYVGHIDDIRITKGVGRYTAAFAPPTAAFPNA